ncbi:MAG TPA: methyltransferase domain-containing protein, partial [Gemmatimonadaceae bacterium]|nr:methyltransferase domain-containing protein [Gemmatimonadaceae bacterium]
MSDSHILHSWHANAAPWTAAVREQQIESRRLVTDRAVLDAIAAACPTPHGGRALDIGCGEGWLSRAMAGLGFRVTGVDAVPSLVEAARAADAGGDYRVLTYEAIAEGALDGEPPPPFALAVANFSLIGGESVDALA